MNSKIRNLGYLFIVVVILLTVYNILIANLFRVLALRSLLEISQQNNKGVQLSGMPCDISHYENVQLDQLSLQKTIRHLNNAINLQPRNFQAYSLLGLTNCLLNKPVASIEMYNRSIDLNPAAIWINIQLISLYKVTGDQYEIDNILRGNDIPVEYLLDVAEWYTSLDEPEKAEQWLIYSKQMDEKNPRLWVLWLSLISKLKQLGEWTKAYESASLAVTIKNVAYISSFYYHMGEIAQYHYRPSRPNNSLRYFENAIYVDKFFNQVDSARTHQYLGEIYWSKRPQYTLEQVMAEYLAAYELDPTFSWTPFAIGRVYLLGYHDYGMAQKYFKLSLSLGNEDPVVLLNLGDSYFQDGKYDQAVETYRQALNDAPDNSELLEKLRQAQSVQEPVNNNP